MEEIILGNKKHGMRTLLLCILVELIALAGIIVGAIMMEEGFGSENTQVSLGNALFAVSMVIFCLAWIPLIGLRILKPQEALVLTLFGKYVGTLKGEGFYAVNPFCSSINPAAMTKLNQSGDVGKTPTHITEGELKISLNVPDKKISLKIL